MVVCSFELHEEREEEDAHANEVEDTEADVGRGIEDVRDKCYEHAAGEDEEATFEKFFPALCHGSWFDELTMTLLTMTHSSIPRNHEANSYKEEEERSGSFSKQPPEDRAEVPRDRERFADIDGDVPVKEVPEIKGRVVREHCEDG